MKPRWNPEVNLGHILILVGLLAPAVVFGFGFAGDFRAMKTDIARLKESNREYKVLFDKLTDNQSNVAKTLEGIRVMIEMHMNYSNKPATP